MRCVTFGEIMMRLNPEGYYRLRQADRLEVSYAGGEANVAASLSQLGMDAAFVTKLPDNDLENASSANWGAMAWTRAASSSAAPGWAFTSLRRARPSAPPR